jgi:DNA-binding MarR family transcriptional regulator
MKRDGALPQLCLVSEIYSSSGCTRQGRLAVTAATNSENPNQAATYLPADVVIRHVERTCRVAVDGRRAVRALVDWSRRFDVSEAEFQILWCLRGDGNGAIDQTSLTRQLAFSPALVSATVEKARRRGWICQQLSDNDRRRNLWHLTLAGRNLLNTMLRATEQLAIDACCGTAEQNFNDGEGRAAA